MSGLIEYVEEYGNQSFEEKSFTTEDALVLSELSYLKFDGVVGGMQVAPISLQDIDKSEAREVLFSEPSYEKDNRAFYKAVIESNRFGGMKLGCYINQIGAEFQFSSITFILPGGITFAAFRGTDETMVGWQEDFSMALKHPVQGQLLSAKYINELAGAISGNFYVGGHSKGGNLAMYAAMYCCDEARERITKVYSFDGPGFRPELLPRDKYELISDRLVKIIPKSSPIGLVFNNSDVTVIEAKAIGPMQHNPYTWVFKDGKLAETKLTEQHLLTVNALNEWIISLNDEDLELFVSYLCWVLNATNATTTTEMKSEFTKHARYLYKANTEVSEETKEHAKMLMHSFLSLTGDLFMKEAKSKYDAFLADLVKMKDEILKKKV